jgi:hypothetical protein
MGHGAVVVDVDVDVDVGFSGRKVGRQLPAENLRLECGPHE